MASYYVSESSSSSKAEILGNGKVGMSGLSNVSYLVYEEGEEMLDDFDVDKDDEMDGFAYFDAMFNDEENPILVVLWSLVFIISFTFTLSIGFFLWRQRAQLRGRRSMSGSHYDCGQAQCINLLLRNVNLADLCFCLVHILPMPILFANGFEGGEALCKFYGFLWQFCFYLPAALTVTSGIISLLTLKTARSSNHNNNCSGGRQFPLKTASVLLGGCWLGSGLISLVGFFLYTTRDDDFGDYCNFQNNIYYYAELVGLIGMTYGFVLVINLLSVGIGYNCCLDLIRRLHVNYEKYRVMLTIVFLLIWPLYGFTHYMQIFTMGTPFMVDQMLMVFKATRPILNAMVTLMYLLKEP